MDRSGIHVGDVFRRFGAEYLAGHPSSAEQRRVLRDVASCRTAALGGHKARCEECGHEECFYNSCCNRHCPRCQAAARKDWLSARVSELLETPYFHVVFTIPEALGPLALQNKQVLYALLFRAAAHTLLQIARDPKHLGAQIGFLTVLHTWGQTLVHHPHLHCVIPGGGISPDRSRWIPSRDSFFLPVRVLSRLFRGKFLAYLRAAIDAGKVKFLGELDSLQDRSRRDSFLRDLSRTEWVVYSKPPFGGPKQALNYLARYTHRVAISDQRLVSIEDGKVTFQYKDYRCGNAQRTMTLDGTEFIRRFLQHVLPASFHRVRYYGFLSNRARKENLALTRRLLASGRHPEPPQQHPDSAEPGADSPDPEPQKHPEGERTCPVCKRGRLVLIETIEPTPLLVDAPEPSFVLDSS